MGGKGGKKFRTDRQPQAPQLSGGGGGQRQRQQSGGGFHTQLQQQQREIADLRKQLRDNKQPKPKWTQPQWDAWHAEKQRRARPPPLSWINNGYQDPTYASVVRRSASALGGSGATDTSGEDDPTTAEAKKAKARQDAKEARERARRVKATGDCSPEEVKRLEDVAEQLQQAVWDDHTDQEEQLWKLDQKAGKLYSSIQKHPLILKEKDDAVEAAREALNRRIQERLDYAAKRAEWQEALDQVKADIERCKAEVERPRGVPCPTPPQPAQGSREGAAGPVLTSLLAQLLAMVGDGNPQAAHLSDQIRAAVGQAAHPGPAAKDPQGDDIMHNQSDTTVDSKPGGAAKPSGDAAQSPQSQQALEDNLKLLEQQRLEELELQRLSEESAREEQRANQAVADKKAKTATDLPDSDEEPQGGGDKA